MSIKIVIDYREKSLKDLFESNEDTSSQIFYENLDIGDVHLAYNPTNLNNPFDAPQVTPLIQVILERKTLNDLACSIKDGRYREQKMRLLKYREDNPHIKILYILEGHYKKSANKYLAYKTFLSCLSNNMMRDGIFIVQSADINETANIILNLATNLIKYPFKQTNVNEDKIDRELDNQNIELNSMSNNSGNSSSYLDVIRIKKKENYNSDICYNSMLMNVPGVSSQISKAISQEYISLVELVKAYDKLDDDKSKINMLKDITFKIKNDKIRKIGPIISAKIYNIIHGLNCS